MADSAVILPKILDVYNMVKSENFFVYVEDVGQKCNGEPGDLNITTQEDLSYRMIYKSQ